MATTEEGTPSLKRNRHNTDSTSSSSNISPDSKRQNTNWINNKYSPLIDIESSENSESNSDNPYSRQQDRNHNIMNFFSTTKTITDT